MNLFQLENIINTCDAFIKQVCLFTLLSIPHQNIYCIEVQCRHLKQLVEWHKPMVHLRNKKGRYRFSCLSFEFETKKDCILVFGPLSKPFFFFVMPLNINLYATALLWVIGFEKRQSYLLIIQLLFSCQSYLNIANQWFLQFLYIFFVYFRYMDIFVAKRVSFYDIYLMYKSNNKLLKIQRKCFLYFLVYSTFSFLLSLLQLNVYSICSVLPKTNPKSVVFWDQLLYTMFLSTL